jgi:hypothetical protein
VLEADLEAVAAGETFQLDQQLEVAASPGREGAERPIVGVKAGGERDCAQGHGVADELAGPGDPSGPPEGDRGMDLPTRAGKVAIDQEAAGTKRRELDAPAFRAPGQVQGELGGRGALSGAARVEPDVSPDSLPEIAPWRADGHERIPSPPEDLDPVLNRVGEDGENEQRDGGQRHSRAMVRER